MAIHYGPWATAFDTGSNPRLSSFWKRRLKMLVPASRTRSALSRRSLSWLAAAGLLLVVLPTFHGFEASAEEEGTGNGERLTVEKIEGADIIIIRERKKEAKQTEKKIADKKSVVSAKKEKKGGPKEWKLANGISMWSSQGHSGAPVSDETKKLISEKKYKFLSTFDSPNGEKQYVYSFQLADGSSFGMNFSMPLDDVSSWDDYLQKQEKQQQERHEKINQAIESGKFRLLNVDPMQCHICRDAESGKKFKVQRIGAGTEREIAFPRADYGEIPPSVKQTSWKEHLEAIRDGKRKLLKSETCDSYTYEMTADDDTKIIFDYGGNEPLKRMPEKKAAEADEEE